MATKKDLSQELNEILDTDIEFEELKKEDLEQLNMMVDEGLLLERLAKHLAKQKGSSKYEEFVEDWEMGSILMRLM